MADEATRRILDRARQSFFSYSRDFLFVKDARLTYLDSSRAFAELTGRERPEELIGKTDFDLFEDQNLARRYRDDDMRVLKNGQPMVDYVEPIPSGDGKKRYCATSKYAVCDEEGRVIGIFGIGRDVTREYEAQRWYENELRCLFQMPEDALAAALLDLTAWHVVDFRAKDGSLAVVSRYETVDGYIAEAEASVVEDERVRAFFRGFSRESVAALYEEGQRVLEMEYLRRMADGGARWVREDAHLLTDPVSDHLSVLFVLRDADPLRRKDGELLRWTEPDVVLKLLEQSLTDGILCTYASQTACPLYYVSDALLRKLGYERGEFERLFAEDTLRAVYEDDVEEAARGLFRVARERGEGVLRFRMRGKDGSLPWFRDTARCVRMADSTEMLVGVFSDISDIMERQRQEELRASDLARSNERIARERDERARAAETDGMTGLYNREATMRRIAAFLRGDGARGVHALLMVDVDDFKAVNDTFGHQMGDSVLTDVAGVIRGCFRDTDIVGRVGGDEFFVLMKNVARREAVRRKAGELVEAMRYVCMTPEARVDLSGSVGVSMCSGAEKPLEALYAEADAALYKAKTFGKNQYAFADERAAAPREDSGETSVPGGAQQMRALLENMAGAMVVLETDGDDARVLYASKSLFNVVSGDPRDVDKRENSLFDQALTEDLPALRGAIARAARENAPLDWSYRARGEDGGVEWRHLRGACMPERDGKVRRMVCVLTDVTGLRARLHGDEGTRSL